MPRASSKALLLYSVLSYWNRLYNSHFVDENAEAQRVCVACLRSHLHYKRLILSRFLAPNPMLVPEGYSPMALFTQELYQMIACRTFTKISTLKN